VDRDTDRPNIRTHPDWILELDGFTARYEIIDGDIFHAVTTGYLEERHMPPMFDRLQNLFNETGLPEDSFYYVNGVKDLRGMTWKARRQYIDFTAKWFKKHPFRLMIIYGANRFMRTATLLGSYFVPFEVKIAADLEGNLSDTNLFLKKDLGYGEEDLINMNIRDLVPEKYRQDFDGYLKRIKANGTDEGVMQLMKKDGTVRVLEYRNTLIHDETAPIENP
jgi:PAS domain S-box-containing protein